MSVIAVVRQFVQNVIVLMLLGTFLQLILPASSVRRYAQLAVGLTMVLTLMTPLLHLLQSSFDVDQLLGQATMQTTWSELQVEAEVLAQTNDQALLSSYRQELAGRVRQLVEGDGVMKVDSCQFVLVEDRQSDDFGRIVGMTVVVSAATVETVSTVTPVNIGKDAATVESPIGLTAKEQARRLTEVRNKLADYFVLTADQVVVNTK